MCSGKALGKDIQQVSKLKLLVHPKKQIQDAAREKLICDLGFVFFFFFNHISLAHTVCIHCVCLPVGQNGFPWLRKTLLSCICPPPTHTEID